MKLILKFTAYGNNRCTGTLCPSCACFQAYFVAAWVYGIMLPSLHLMSKHNFQEASSPAQQGSPLSVTQHANNSLDEPVSDSNVSTTNHGLTAVEAEEWVDEGEEIEVEWMS